MRINYLSVDERSVTFRNHVLIYSSQNSVGKTTLLRLLLYAMGFPVPSTKGINFEKVKTKVEIEKNNKVLLLTRENAFMKVYQNNKLLDSFDTKDYESIAAIVFGSSDERLLNNILAPFYFDQEKGWTLLNRGKVIGGIQFNIEKYLEGIGSQKLDEYHLDIMKLNRDINFYGQLKKIVVANDDVKRNITNLDWDEYDDHENKLRTIELQIERLKSQIDQLQEVKTNDKKLVNMVNNLNIVIRTKSGEKEYVTKENIVGYDINQSVIDVRLVNLNRQLREEQTKSRVEQGRLENLDLFNLESKVDRFRESLTNLDMTPESLETILSDLKKKRNKLNKQIKNIINGSKVTTELYSTIKEYAKILDVEEYIDNTSEFILTSNLKRYSGAILHLIVFAYRMALLKMLGDNTGIKPPIIIDSPLSGELDQKNVKKMFKLLNLEFSDYQIIVASIDKLNDVDFNWDKRIVMKDSLFETLSKSN